MDKYTHPGPVKQTPSQQGHAALVLAGVIPAPKKRKARAKGYKVNRQEDKDRPEITKRLRRDGWKIRFVEPHGRSKDGDFSLGDVWMSNARMKQAGWGEYKSSSGRLKAKQKLFRDDCCRDGVNYWVIRLMGDGYSMTEK